MDDLSYDSGKDGNNDSKTGDAYDFVHVASVAPWRAILEVQT